MNQQTQKRVTFGDLTVRLYPIIIGDHPVCSGCPITIDWEPMETYTSNLEVHEYSKTLRDSYSSHNSSRCSSNRKFSVHQRSQMLLDAGYTQEQIVRKALEMAELQSLREESLKKSSPPHQFERFGKLLSKKLKISKIGFGSSSNKLLGLHPKPPVKATTISARMA